MRSTAALENTVAAWRIERPECEPPPTLTTSVSPMMMLHALDRHVKQIGDHLGEARLVALPARLRADDDIDAAAPGSHRDLRLLAAARRSRIRHNWRARGPSSLPRALGLAAPRRESLPVGDVHRPVHVLFVVAAVVEHADRVAIRHRLRRARDSCGAARCGRRRVRPPPRRPGARSRRSLPAGPSCDRHWSAWCW